MQSKEDHLIAWLQRETGHALGRGSPEVNVTKSLVTRSASDGWWKADEKQAATRPWSADLVGSAGQDLRASFDRVLEKTGNLGIAVARSCHEALPQVRAALESSNDRAQVDIFMKNKIPDRLRSAAVAEVVSYFGDGGAHSRDDLPAHASLVAAEASAQVLDSVVNRARQDLATIMGLPSEAKLYSTAIAEARRRLESVSQPDVKSLNTGELKETERRFVAQQLAKGADPAVDPEKRVRLAMVAMDPGWPNVDYREWGASADYSTLVTEFWTATSSWMDRAGGTRVAGLGDAGRDALRDAQVSAFERFTAFLRRVYLGTSSEPDSWPAYAIGILERQVGTTLGPVIEDTKRVAQLADPDRDAANASHEEPLTEDAIVVPELAELDLVRHEDEVLLRLAGVTHLSHITTRTDLAKAVASLVRPLALESRLGVSDEAALDELEGWLRRAISQREHTLRGVNALVDAVTADFGTGAFLGGPEGPNADDFHACVRLARAAYSVTLTLVARREQICRWVDELCVDASRRVPSPAGSDAPWRQEVHGPLRAWIRVRLPELFCGEAQGMRDVAAKLGADFQSGLFLGGPQGPYANALASCARQAEEALAATLAMSRGPTRDRS